MVLEYIHRSGKQRVTVVPISLTTMLSYPLAGFVLPELMMLNSDNSKILVPRRKTLVPRHKNCVPLNLKLQLLPGHFGLVDQQINKGVTFLIEIIDPDYHEELGHLWGLVVSLCHRKMGNGQFQKLAR